MQQRPEIVAMQDRLKKALADEAIASLVQSDLTHTFKGLGMPDNEALFRVKCLISGLAKTNDIEAFEQAAYAELKEVKVGNGLNVLQVLETMLANRASLIYQQIIEYVRLKGEPIIDWGCGDGQVTNLIYTNNTRNIHGFDVRGYRAPGVNVPITVFDGSSVPVKDGYYQLGIMTNVAHHDANNAKILAELARIIADTGRLVVIETVPILPIAREFERTFVGDYVYNRIFHQDDVPVPGTYETQDEWVQRFLEVGFELDDIRTDEHPIRENPLPLGYDQPLIKDWHTLMVFRRRVRD